MGTQLYDKDHKKIYPNSEAVSITTSGNSSVNNKNTVEACLIDLYSMIGGILGDEEAVNTIQYKVTYCRHASKNQADVASSENWSESFVLPTAEKPYVWKKTVISYAGATDDEKQIFYEIVASDVAEKSQTIYMATSSGSNPVIDYPVKRDPETGEELEDEEGNKVIDLTIYDNKLPDGWLETPQPISPSFPFAFMSTRKRIEGKWQKFSDPAQYGRWAFDSQVELRYAITGLDETPTLNNTADSPEGWSISVADNFTGKLWMITASSVGGTINADVSGIKWRGPYLISVVR